MSDICAGDSPQLAFRFVRSDGEEFNFGRGGWMILKDGFEDAANLAYTVSTSKNILTDGSSLVAKRAEETDRTITAEYRGDSPDRARSEAIAFFNFRFSFELHVTYRGNSRWCLGELKGFKADSGSPFDDPRITVTLLCLDPFWRSESHNDFAFGDSTPMLGWPYVSHVRMVGPKGERYPVGNPVSILIYDGKNTLINTGDVEAPYTIQVRAGGELINPTITKDGKFIKVLVTMQSGDVLLIDYESRRTPQVTLNGKNVIQQCSRDSSFTGMMIQPGTNVFTFTIDNTINRLLSDVRILYYKRYTGV